VISLRLRNLKNKEDIMNNCDFLITEPFEYIGRWNKLFNNNNPIYIEIGMGFGKFIYENALKNPNINYIGIEKYDNVVARAIKKIEKLDNLIIIRMDARFIDKVFDKEIDRIYLNFSDPWPKKGQANRRLTSPYFLELYDKIFKSNNNIHMKTDNSKLFAYSIESLNNYGYKLSNITFDLHKDESSVITTEYEEKFVSKGNNIYYLEANK
jgi:tRNA (guanine-N7-)-methyltransferase